MPGRIVIHIDRQLTKLPKDVSARWRDWLGRHQLDPDRIIVGHPMIITDHRIQTSEWDNESCSVVDVTHTFEAGPLLPPAGFRMEEVDD